MADAVEAPRQDVEKEAADELPRRQRPARLAAGTTADVRVTPEERTPITLVLPFLNKLLGR